jgi:hypothetical protein
MRILAPSEFKAKFGNMLLPNKVSSLRLSAGEKRNGGFKENEMQIAFSALIFIF